MTVLLSSAKNEAFFDILMTITPGVNMISRKMTPFFIYSLTSIRWYTLFLHFKSFKIQSPLCILFCFVKYTFTRQKWHLTWISFSYLKLLTFGILYNLLPIWHQFGPYSMDYTCRWCLPNQKSNNFAYLIRKTMLISNIYDKS